MKKKSFAVGLDIGTGGCKTAVVGSDGVIVSSSVREYPTSSPQPLWSEQDPNDWYGSASDTLKEAVERGGVDPADIVSICINGQPHTLVLLDNSDEILRPAIVWTDQRSSGESARLKESFGDLFMRAGFNQVNPTWTVSMLAWIRHHEPHTWRRISKIMLPKDFIRFKLTGKWSTDWTDAAGTLLADVEKKQWSDELCRTISLPPELLPEITSPLCVAGKVTKEASQQTGLPEGAEVFTGACDPAAELFGAGLLRGNQLAIKLATAGVVFATADTPHPHPQILTYPHVLPGMWLSVAATNACSSSVRWFRDLFCVEEIRTAEELGRNPYELMDEEAEMTNTGVQGPLYHPYLQGERSPYWDPDLRGSFTGLRMDHQRGHLIRAIYEGVSFSVNDCLELIRGIVEQRRHGAAAEERAVLLGGGAKSGLWSRILSDVLGIELGKLESVDASFGSALMGGVGASLFESPQEAVRKSVRISETIKPDFQNHSLYSKRFALYKKIHDALADIYRDL